jgi:MFS family permease
MKSRSSLTFIFLTIFIDLLGIGIVLPLLPEYVKIVERSTWPWLAENRALIVGALTASYALMQFLFAPVLGALSDRFGRRPVLLLSLMGTGLSYLVFALTENLTSACYF